MVRYCGLEQNGETVGATVRNVLNSEESRLFSWVAITIDKASSFFYESKITIEEKRMARHKKGDDVNGWLVIDKPRDIGSTQVVNLTRKWLNAKKNGHCGTLDPFATGVLPVAFGEATKLIPLITDGPKEYEFVIKWGEATASGDTESEVCQRSAIIPSKEDILSVLPRFIGKISQVPPAYSAIKINGERAYNLARRGEDVEIPERIVEIYALELLEELPEEQARFRVACSKGTYVRTLGQDIAKSLGTVGHLKELRRTKCGNFDLSQKILLENIKNIGYGENRKEVLLPVITCLRDIADIAVTEADAAKLRMGQILSPKSYPVEKLYGQTGAATCDGELVALVRIEERRILPVRVFNF